MVSVDELKQLGTRCSNWGRWGPDDEIGTLNLITAEQRLRAVSLVRSGKIFDLGMPLSSEGPQPGGLRFNPIHRMSATPVDFAEGPGGMIASDDMIIMPLQAGTQWDSLAHVGYDGRFYNDTPASVVGSLGATRNSIDKGLTRLLGRGVLLDVARLHDKARLSPEDGVTAADLDAAAERQGVEILAGDILFVRTGWYQVFTEGDHASYLGASPGLRLDCVEWLHDRDVAAVVCDNSAVEQLPGEVEGVPVPLHMVLIRDVGLTLGEMFNLEELAADCAGDGVWEFLFSGPPLKIPAAVGSPLSPLALK